MRVPFQLNAEPSRYVELLVIGNCLAVQEGKQEPMMRIGPLSRMQWKLLADVAASKVEGA